MSNFSFERTSLEGLMVVTPFFRADDRGSFLKSFEKEVFARNGIDLNTFEIFESVSAFGVIRGLHFQTETPQAKYVRAIKGDVFDVALDLRKGSLTFGKWHGEYLTESNRKGFYIPEGFAHGFQALSEGAKLSYVCGSAYSPETDTGIMWNDPDIAIDWPIKEGIITSERDASFESLSYFSENYKGL